MGGPGSGRKKGSVGKNNKVTYKNRKTATGITFQGKHYTSKEWNKLQNQAYKAKNK